VASINSNDYRIFERVTMLTARKPSYTVQCFTALYFRTDQINGH